MICKNTFINANLYIDNALSEEEVILFESHLNDCAACSKLFDELNEINDLLQENEKPIPFDLTETIMNKIAIYKLNQRYQENNKLKLIILLETIFVLIITFLSLPQLLANLKTFSDTVYLNLGEISSLNDSIINFTVSSINSFHMINLGNISIGIYIGAFLLCLIFNLILINKLRRQII